MVSKNPLKLTEADIKEILDEMGGMEALREDHNDFRKAVSRLRSERASLVKIHPHKWVAMSKDGAVSVGGSIEEVVAATESQGISNSNVMVEYLDPKPEPLILWSGAGSAEGVAKLSVGL